MTLAPLWMVLKNRNYALYSAGNTVSLIGTWIQIIAFGWLTWQMTHSPLWLGIISAAAIVPTLIGGLIGGYLADQMDRLTLTVITQIVSIILALAMFGLHASGHLTLIHMVTIKALLSAATAISQPARMAIVTRLVRPDQLGTAISFSSMTFNLARFIGPAVAGIIIASLGIGATFLVNAGTFALMTLTMLLMKLPKDATNPKKSAPASNKGKPSSVSLMAALAGPGILCLFALQAIVVVSVRPVSEFFPAIATLQFNSGIEAVATLTSCLAAGSILGGLWTSGRPIMGQTRTTLIASALYAVCIIAFMQVSSLWLGAIILIIAGMFTAVFAITAQTLIQASTPDEARGRVLSLWFILTRAGPDMGALTMGFAATALSLHNALIAGSLICLAATGLTWFMLRQRYQDIEKVEAAAS